MPREAQALVRNGGFRNAEKFYILSFEGSVTEKKYFEDLRKSEYFNDSGLIETIPLPRESTESNPLVVKKLLKEAKDNFNFRDSDEFWLIIDKDEWEKIHHINLNQLASDCQYEKNFYLALSNPCFELWLILHLTDLSKLTDKERNRLRDNPKINPSSKNSKHYVDKVIEQAMNNGRGYNKKPNPRIFLPYIPIAIIRAKALSKEGELFPSDLGTDVYKLVEKLIK